jgi:hypothetical protein
MAALVSLLASCGDGIEADADMNRDLDRVFEHASALEGELDRHAGAIETASSVADVQAAEASHEEAMNQHVSDMDHVLGDMTMYCRHRDSEERGRTHDMQSAMSAMRGELDRHRTSTAADLEAARSEEQKHLGESRALIKRVRDDGNAMRHEAGFYRCEHGNH